MLSDKQKLYHKVDRQVDKRLQPNFPGCRPTEVDDVTSA